MKSRKTASVRHAIGQRRRCYISSLCNFMHDVATGEPVDHHCVKIPLPAIAAERRGDFDRANEILRGRTLTTRSRSPLVD